MVRLIGTKINTAVSEIDIGLLGELLVQQKLVERGWHPVGLDTRRAATNADLFAIRREHRCAVQVKSTAGGKAHSHSDCIHLGNAGPHLRSKAPFFNSKPGPLLADVVVGVNYTSACSRFFVLPVALAEALCQHHANYWSQIEKREGGKRKEQFPVYLSIAEGRRAHVEFHQFIRRNVQPFEDRWDLLCESTDRLRHPQSWRMV